MNIGVLGGGQLARMLALAGHPLGLQLTVVDPGEAACAAVVARHLCAELDDPAALDRLIAQVDCVTFETENVPPAALERLAGHIVTYPAGLALQVARDRLREKDFLTEHGIPAGPYAAVDDQAGLERAVSTIGLPAVLKTRTMGYDGKGQLVLRRPEDAARAFARLGGVPLILEAFVHFEREVSIVAARDRAGTVAFYDLVENTHHEGILRLSVPRPGDRMQALAERHARRLMEALGYVGVLALELFQVGDELRANEMAPRVHNSGHWTIEGARTSQFENHLRAIAGFALGDPSTVRRTAMINLIGELPDVPAVLAVPGAHVHVYGKAPAPGRKIGHVTVEAEDEAGLARAIDRVHALLPVPPPR